VFLAGALEGTQNLTLHSEQSGLDRRGAPKPPEERRKAMDELLLDRRLRQILHEDRCLERLVFALALERLDDGLGGESVPESAGDKAGKTLAA
jgi:hypothetical protein